MMTNNGVTYLNDTITDRQNKPLEFWATLVQGRLFGLSYTTYPRWTVENVEFVL